MEKRIFTFIIEGQYYGSHGSTGLPVVKAYRAEFRLPTLEGALSTIVKFLLDPYLVKHYEDYARFRTHKIVSKSYTGRPASVQVLQMSFEDMGVQDLADFCILKDIYIDPYQHKDPEKCRTEIARIYQARTDQKRQDEKSGKAKEQKEIDQLLELNNIPKVDANIPNINMQRTAAALKNRGDGKALERVGSENISVKETTPLPAENGIPAGAMEEIPVDNDPKLTAQAFEEAAAKSLGLEPAGVEGE